MAQVKCVKTYKIFISHAWTADDEYDRLVSLLDQVTNFKWENCCKPRSNHLNPANQADNGSEQKLRYQIYPADIVIILLDMYRCHREWMEKEMNVAREMKKPVTGILPWSNPPMAPEVEKAVPITLNWDCGIHH